MSTPALTPEQYEVQRILQRGHSQGQRFYLVKWRGFPDEEATWEPEANLNGCRKAIVEFQQIMKIVQQQQLMTQNHQHNKKRKKNKKHTTPSKSHPLNQASALSPVKPKQNSVNQTPDSKNTVENPTPLPQNKHSPDLSFDSKNHLPKSPKTKKNQKNVSTQKDLAKQSVETDESIELEPSTAQTMPPNNKTNKSEFKDFEFKSQQIQAEKFANTKFIQKDCLNLEYNKEIPNVQSNQTTDPTKESDLIDITHKSEHLNIFKRQSTVQNPLNQDTEKVPENLIKKRLLSSLEDPIIVLDKQNNVISKISHLKITRNVSEICMPAQTKNEQRKILFVKRQLQNKIHQMSQTSIFPAVSQRSKVCEEESEEFNFQLIDWLLPLVKSTKNTPNKLIVACSLKKIDNLTSAFIDLTKPKFMDVNKKLFSRVLAKEEVELEDKKGEFIYSRIGGLIKGVERRNETLVESWVCLMIDCGQEGNQSQESELIVRLIRVDDLEESLWKKLFRRFTMKIKSRISIDN